MSGDDAALFNSICADFEDILPSDLHDTFSRVLGAQYLQETNDPNHQPHVRGVAWGTNLRPIISLHVQITDSILTLSGTKRPIHVHFLYLAASPQTYLSDETLRVLGIEDLVVVGEALNESSMRLPLKINGYTIRVQRSPPDGHFAHLNILGQDFIHLTGAQVFFGGHIPRFEITFP
ncbi:hypothetical protein BGZ83_010949 [Gryganskiella cystojenkinii]|nr:hypothetical protein BGZ83_010949 [Gryganskiella cystojenkinii]